MFDAHIEYFCYNNVEGDEFQVGHLGNKDNWVSLMNGWNRNDGRKQKYTIEDWDDLDQDEDLRGCQLAEVIADEKDYVVSWATEEGINVIRISHKNGIVWEENNTGADSVPRWVNRLKNTIRDAQS